MDASNADISCRNIRESTERKTPHRQLRLKRDDMEIIFIFILINLEPTKECQLKYSMQLSSTKIRHNKKQI